MYIPIQERSIMNKQATSKKEHPSLFSELKWFDSGIRYGEPDFTLKYYYGATCNTNNDLICEAEDGHPVVFIHIPDYRFDKASNKYIYDHTYPINHFDSSSKAAKVLSLLKDRVGTEVYAVFATVKAESSFESSGVKEVRPLPRPLKVDLVDDSSANQVRVVLSAPPMPRIDF